MRRWLSFLLFLFLLADCTASNEQENSYRQISMDEAVTMMEEKRLVRRIFRNRRTRIS